MASNIQTFQTPEGSKLELKRIIDECATRFPENAVLRKVDAETCTMDDYHSLLTMIFHQTFHGPSFLALAGVNCTANRVEARDYLFKHAEEEMTHWMWVLNDLHMTNYQGPDPRTQFPPEPCQSYLSFNFWVASKEPLARLAIATMLETLGATCGKKYALKITKILNLRADQAKFFFGHGDTDVGHTKELWAVLDNCQLTPVEWGTMCSSVSTAFKMYFRMYDEAAT